MLNAPMLLCKNVEELWESPFPQTQVSELKHYQSYHFLKHTAVGRRFNRSI